MVSTKHGAGATPGEPGGGDGERRFVEGGDHGQPGQDERRVEGDQGMGVCPGQQRRDPEQAAGGHDASGAVALQPAPDGDGD
jgi:hypothetical protein